jgi:glycosyltransferase involved in cell wall biosynthesis
MAPGPRIVIVTYNWPPRNASGTHRPYSWARYWSAKGAQVTVLTAAKYAFDAPLDLDLPPLAGVEVVEVPYLRDSKRRLAGLAPLVGKKWLTRIKTVLKRLTGGEAVDPRRAWEAAAGPVAARLAGRCDIVVSTFGPSSCHVIASAMKRANPALRWVADYRDPWSGNAHLGLTEAERSAERTRELETIAPADLLTTVSGELAANLAALTGKPVRVVENGFDLSDATVRANVAAAGARPGTTKPFRIVHTGMIYAGLRDPQPLLAALAAMKDAGEIEEGDVMCEFYGERLYPLDALAAELAYRPFCRIHGYVPRTQALAIQHEANLLLLLETPDAPGTIPGKVYEYLASGTPILSVGSRRQSAVGDLLDYTGGGCCLERNVEAIAHLLRGMLAGEPSGWFKPDVDRILQFSRESRAELMFEILMERKGQAAEGLGSPA